jgi:hypothetical protein
MNASAPLPSPRALQVHGVAEELLDRERGIIRCQHLPVANLRSGIFHRRGASEFNAALCPLCGLEPSGATVEERGRVGLARYRKGAFVVTPCKRDECAEKMRERQRRLSGGEVKTLYHQTSAATARRIHDGGGFLMRGQEGIAGGGIYFAFSARETEWKCEHGDDDAVVLECAVRVGKTREVERGDEDEETTFAELIQDGVDSVLLKRGVCKDAGPFYGKPAGDEVVVYSWEQARVLRTVPRDPVP